MCPCTTSRASCHSLLHFPLPWQPILTFHRPHLTFQDAEEYAQCEACVKAYVPFQEAMRKRGVENMDLVMVDPW